MFNKKLLDEPINMGTLTKQTFATVEASSGRTPVRRLRRDIDHFGNALRTVGELIQNQVRVGLSAWSARPRADDD
jgi:DNA-directed RNA polymerase beta subunit